MLAKINDTLDLFYWFAKNDAATNPNAFRSLRGIIRNQSFRARNEMEVLPFYRPLPPM